MLIKKLEIVISVFSISNFLTKKILMEGYLFAKKILTCTNSDLYGIGKIYILSVKRAIDSFEKTGLLYQIYIAINFTIYIVSKNSLDFSGL